MPATPEFRDRPGDVGVVEVFQIMKTQHTAHADGHVGIRGEIQIDLETVSDQTQPCTKNRETVQRLSTCNHIRSKAFRQDHRLCKSAAGIGKQYFLGKTHGEPGNTLSPLRGSGLSAEEFQIDGFVPNNGACNALVKQSGIQKNIPVALLYLGIAPVYINDVGKKLEGIEGNTDGKNNIADENRNIAKDAENQSGIFKIADQTDINHCGKTYKNFFADGRSGPVYTQRAKPGCKCHEHQQKGVLRLTPGIENQRENQKNRILRFPRPAKAVSQKGQGEKGI